MTSPISMDEIFNMASPEPNSGCWLWTGSAAGNNYGQFYRGGRKYYVTRLVMELVTGHAPSSKELVCHRCDMPLCVNPDHLFLGTHQDNVDDMNRKGRGRLGKHKMAPEVVLEIFDLYHTDGWLQVDLAEAFGVTQTTISDITRRRTHRVATPPPPERPIRHGTVPRGRITVAEIVARIKSKRTATTEQSKDLVA